VAAAGLGFGYVQLREVRDLRAELGRTVQRLRATSDRLMAREATLNAIFEPGVQMFQLTASGDPDPLIQLFWDRERHRAIVHGFKLESVPEGRAYQLWFIKDGAPVPSVTFKPEPTGHVKVEHIPVPADGEVSAAAVTVEPESGSTQPTTPILLVGPLKRS
jgi:anti-sigma-K factor RskA